MDVWPDLKSEDDYNETVRQHGLLDYDDVPPCEDDILEHYANLVKLRPHQEKVLEQLGNGKVLWGDVGTGKSIVAAAYYMRREAPRDVFVITTAKKRDSVDWEGEFVKFGVGTSQDATVAGVLTVDSWNNIGNYTSVHNAFFIFDEQRVVGSGAWTKAFLHIAKSNRWILLSATPGDTWLDYIPLFLANGWYKNRTQFKREHVIYSPYSKFPKVERYVGINKLVKYKNQLLVEMPYERHTTRKTSYIPVRYDKQLFDRVLKDRWHVYENRPLRDVAELFSVMRKVVNSDLSRLETIRSLMEKHPRLIVFYNFDYELQMLRTLAHQWPEEDAMYLDASTKSSISTKLSISERSLQEERSSSTCDSSPLGQQLTDSGRSSGSTRTQPKLQKTYSDRPTHHSPTKSSTKNPTVVTTHGPTNSKIQNSQSERESSTNGSTSDTCLTKASSESQESYLERKYGISSDSSSKTGSGNGSSHSSAEVDESSYSLQSEPRSLDPDEQSRSEKLCTSEMTYEDSRLKFDSSTTFAVAEWNGHKHEPIPDTDRWVYLVQYIAGSEGWNCTSTDAMVFWSLTYSYKQWHQAHGRIDRLNTPFSELHYYVLKSDSVIDKVVMKSLKDKKNFNETRFAAKL